MGNIFGWYDAGKLIKPVLVDAAGNLTVVMGAGSALIGKVDINSFLASLPAGTNNIGDIDVLSLPSIPAGSNIIGYVRIDGALGSLPAGINTIGGVNIMAALPTGNNNIGNVDIVTLPSLPAGTNNIGDIDVLSLPSIPAGSNIIGKVDINTIPVTQVKAVTGSGFMAYNSRQMGSIGSSNLAAGTNVFDSSSPASGQFWHIGAISFYYVGTVAGVGISANIYNGTTEYVFPFISPPVSGQVYSYTVDWILSSIDKIRLRVSGATLNDDAWLNFNGYAALIS